ncbi:MAG: hypothetical protein ACE15C_03385 [Phycisphaerae bacterium]
MNHEQEISNVEVIDLPPHYLNFVIRYSLFDILCFLRSLATIAARKDESGRLGIFAIFG